MVKSLATSGLVQHELRKGVQLNAADETLALGVLRRHGLMELFLVDVLNFGWSIVHEEAETLEYAVSERVLERIDALLGHPIVEPHGDPIPGAQRPSRRAASDEPRKLSGGRTAARESNPEPGS